jgi:hypothetical protein
VRHSVLLMEFRDVASVLWATTSIMSIGLILSSLEWLRLRHEFGSMGIFDWKVVSLRHRFSPSTDGVLRKLAGPVGVELALGIRALAACWCLAFPLADLRIPLGILVATNLFMQFRCKYGLEGSDQMLSLISISLWIGALSQNVRVFEQAIYFIAAQSILSYFVAGLAKLYGPLWRNGLAIACILNTRDFGHSNFSSLLGRFPPLGRLLTYFIVTFECTFPLVLVLPYYYVILYILLGTVFHMATAILMGLNMFVWAFIATYPAVLYLAYRTSQAIYG